MSSGIGPPVIAYDGKLQPLAKQHLSLEGTLTRILQQGGRPDRSRGAGTSG